PPYASRLRPFVLPPQWPMDLRLHGSTLFPYTTLFRSSLYFCNPLKLFSIELQKGQINICLKNVFCWVGYYISDKTAIYTCNKRRDRKSTRLNSSHVKISYAVFCLKNKRYAEAEDASRH